MSEPADTPVSMPPWTRVLDDGTGCFYYFNTRTGDSVWETPAVIAKVRAGQDPNAPDEPVPPPPAPVPPSYADVIDLVSEDLAGAVSSGGEEDNDGDAGPAGFHKHRSSVAFTRGPDGVLTPKLAGAAKTLSPDRPSAEELPDGETKHTDFQDFAALVQSQHALSAPPPIVTSEDGPKRGGLLTRLMSRLKGPGKGPGPLPATPPTASSMQAHVQFSPVAAAGTTPLCC